MAGREKRPYEESGDGHDARPPERKQRVSFSSVAVEAMRMDILQKLGSSLEPLLRRVVSEELERVLVRLSPTLPQNKRAASPKMLQGSTARDLRLSIRTKLALPLFTSSKVEGEQGTNIVVVLQDMSNEGQVVSTGPESNCKLEVVALEGDFNADDDEDWKHEEFERNVVRERDGKRPLLNGDLTVNLKEGVASLGDIAFTDNSSWNRSRKFRLGVRVAGGGGHASESGVRIREAKTEAFNVKDHRGELYKKHYPPALQDEVWRLDRIGKDGAFHKRLNKAGLVSVEDFLRMVIMDPIKLREILGSGMSNKMWEGTVDHAMTCVLNSRMYVYYPADRDNVGVIFNNICQLMGLVADGQYIPVHLLKEPEKIYVDRVMKAAYEDWDHVVEYDGDLPVSSSLALSAAALRAEAAAADGGGGGGGQEQHHHLLRSRPQQQQLLQHTSNSGNNSNINAAAAGTAAGTQQQQQLQPLPPRTLIDDSNASGNHNSDHSNANNTTHSHRGVGPHIPSSNALTTFSPATYFPVPRPHPALFGREQQQPPPGAAGRQHRSSASHVHTTNSNNNARQHLQQHHPPQQNPYYRNSNSSHTAQMQNTRQQQQQQPSRPPLHDASHRPQQVLQQLPDTHQQQQQPAAPSVSSLVATQQPPAQQQHDHLFSQERQLQSSLATGGAGVEYGGAAVNLNGGGELMMQEGGGGGEGALTDFDWDMSEDEIRNGSREVLGEDDEMQVQLSQILRIFNPIGGSGDFSALLGGGGGGGTAAAAATTAVSHHYPGTPEIFYDVTDIYSPGANSIHFDPTIASTRLPGARSTGWLKLKAALRWIIFVRKRAAARRARIEEVQDE